MVSTASGNGKNPSDHLIRQRFAAWIDRAIDRALPKGSFKRRAPPPLEPLPSPRPRPITPSNGSLLCHPQKQSRFFSRLPPEIRRAILLYAFGNRAVHMDLSYERPMLDCPNIESGAATLPHAAFNEKRDASEAKQWRWRSSVCHRNAPWYPFNHRWWLMNWHRPDIDSCMKGNGFACRAWLGDWPAKCQVGALGWILSCRQAYVEGIGLLYMTNTFHIASHELFTRLPYYILPSRLAQMSSFEIVLSLSVSKDQRGPLKPRSATLAPLLDMLAQSTGIRQLFLCLSCRELQRSVAEVDVEHLLKTMDDFVRKSDLESTVLQVNPVVLEGLTAKACSRDASAPPKREDYTHQLWRCLDDETGQAEIHERVCYYPLIRFAKMTRQDVRDGPICLLVNDGCPPAQSPEPPRFALLTEPNMQLTGTPPLSSS